MEDMTPFTPNTIRLVVLGGKRVGKSAVTVRYLTKRYIGEYSTGTDFVYHHHVNFDSVTVDIEILDSCDCKVSRVLDHLRWGSAFVVVYSVSDYSSFLLAEAILHQLQQNETGIYATLLLANKRDLEHARQVGVEAGQALSLQWGCQFYEVSAAESATGVALAFLSLLREAHALQLLRSLPLRRKVNSVSRVLGTIFGAKTKTKRPKRPSLSI